MERDSIYVLHLTDIHAGQGEIVDEDGKISVPRAERMKQLSRLSGYIEHLPKKPAYVVVSGDITIQGQSDGMEKFRSWLFSHISAGHLPSADRIIVVPGNLEASVRSAARLLRPAERRTSSKPD